MSTNYDMTQERKGSQLKKYSLAAGERSQAVKAEAIRVLVYFFGWRGGSCAERAQ